MKASKITIIQEYLKQYQPTLINIEADLNEDDLKQIVTNITMKYSYLYDTPVRQNVIKEEIQEAINQYTIQKRRDSLINQIIGDEPTIPNKRINLTIDIKNSMLD